MNVRIATADQHILDRIMAELPDYEPVPQPTRTFDYMLKMKIRTTPSPLKVALASLGIGDCRSHEKFIPDIYKRGSVAQRLAVLQGLLDTDGSVGNGTHATFTSTSERLARDVQEIAWSLGARAKISARQTHQTKDGVRKPGRPSWRVSIVHPDVATMFTLPRKVQQCTPKVMKHRLRFTGIEHVGREPAVCIAIDHQDHLYVTDDYIVTHNTDLLKRFLQLTPPSHRIVTIEDNPEFGGLGPRNRVSLFYTDGKPGMEAEDALKSSLRLRPDEIWMQEVRGGEAFAYLRALAAGHPGGGTSWHAEEGREFDALELMVRQHPAGRAIPDDKIREYLTQYLDIVVWCNRGDDGFQAPRVWFKAAEEIGA